MQLIMNEDRGSQSNACNMFRQVFQSVYMHNEEYPGSPLMSKIKLKFRRLYKTLVNNI